jgi:hypothetical protein
MTNAHPVFRLDLIEDHSTAVAREHFGDVPETLVQGSKLVKPAACARRMFERPIPKGSRPKPSVAGPFAVRTFASACANSDGCAVREHR